MEVERSTLDAPWRWPLLISVIFLNLFLPSLILSYGTVLVHAVHNGAHVWLAFTTPTIFLLTYYLTQCWSREAADSWGGNVGHRVMASLGLLLVVAGVFASAYVPHDAQPFLYGGLGGLGSSLISAQVDAVIFESYDSNLGIIRGLCFMGQAVGHSLFPHVITAFVDYYGYSQSFILLSASMLQTLPAIMFLKVDESVRRLTSYSRYSDISKTYALFDNNFPTGKVYANEFPLQSMSSQKSWKSLNSDNEENHVSDDELEEDDEVNTDNITVTPPPSPEEKRRNIFGVEIMPEIPEESEDDTSIQTEDNRRKSLNNVVQRLSSIGDSFDEYITRQTRSDSIDEQTNGINKYSEVEVTYDTIAPMTEIAREKMFNSFSFRCRSKYASMRRKLWMPSYKVYRMRRRIQYCLYSCNDTFFKPLTRSLSCWRFYPVLLLSVARLSLVTVFLTLLPLIGVSINPSAVLFETNFMMSLHGLTWACFLVSTPWLAHTLKRNNKFVATVGLFLSAAACYGISKVTNYDSFCIGCVVAGLGFGSVTSCWEPAIQEFVGGHKWPKLHSTVETLSGLSIAILVGVLANALREDHDLQYCLLILSYFIAGVGGLWFIICAVSVLFCKGRLY